MFPNKPWLRIKNWKTFWNESKILPHQILKSINITKLSVICIMKKSNTSLLLTHIPTNISPNSILTHQDKSNNFLFQNRLMKLKWLFFKIKFNMMKINKILLNCQKNNWSKPNLWLIMKTIYSWKTENTFKIQFNWPKWHQNLNLITLKIISHITKKFYMLPNFWCIKKTP